MHPVHLPICQTAKKRKTFNQQTGKYMQSRERKTKLNFKMVNAKVLLPTSKLYYEISA